MTHDTEFEQWANKVWNFGSGLGAEVSLADFRKDITLEVYNEAGQLALAYHVFRCWVSEYRRLPDLDANANAVAIQTLKLENEGWEQRSGRRRTGRGVLQHLTPSRSCATASSSSSGLVPAVRPRARAAASSPGCSRASRTRTTRRSAS